MFVKNFQHLLDMTAQKDKKKIAVAAADDAEVLEVVAKAEEMGIAEFVLIGDCKRLEKLIAENSFAISAELVEEADHKKAAELAVEMTVTGKTGAAMKGMLHSAVFLKAVLNKEKGLNTGRRITQVCVIEKEDEDGMLLITDCAISVKPDLLEKKDILQNAVELAHGLGYEMPRVAMLASVEVVNPAMPETLDAAVLSKMAERGQIKGCIVDGPLAFDNAVSLEAAQHKGIGGEVAGRADVIVVPDLNVGNTLSKSITHIAKKELISATVGTSAPIVYTSRTASIESKLLSIALASYMA